MAAAHPPSARCLALESVLSSHVQLRHLRGTLASAHKAGGHPRCPKSPRGHHIPEENQPQFCASPKETFHPCYSLCSIAHLCKAPWAACDLSLVSDGTLGFKIHTHRAIERTTRVVTQGFAVTCLETQPLWQPAGSWQGEPVLTALMLGAGIEKPVGC